jgi:hypothetical protein
MGTGAAVSFTDPIAPWVTEPLPGEPIPLPVVILAALAYTALNLRDIGWCEDCGLLLCPDHRADEAFAAACEAVYAQVAAVSTEWADLAISIEAGMN